MVKKFAALAAGLSMVLVGVVPVFAQVTDTDTSTTEVELLDTMTLTVTANGGETPFGTGATAQEFTPTSSTVSTKFRETTKTTLVMTTNSAEGGTISADGTGTSGVLTGGTGGTDTIPNATAGLNFDGACVADMESSDDFTGLAASVDSVASHADFFYSGATTLATKYGAWAAAATRNWCHFDGTDRQIAETTAYHEASTSLLVGYLVGVKAGEQTGGVYDETITYTGTAN